MQVREWTEQGFVLVDGLLPLSLIQRLAESARRRFPAPTSDEAQRLNDFGGGMTFPDEDPTFNELTLHPRLAEAVAQLLTVAISELRLTQSDLWPKYGRPEGDRGDYDNQDQRIHVDYPNHTMTHPAPWDEPEAVEAIVYLCDQQDVGGPTAVVPREGRDDIAYRWPITDTPGIDDIPWINDRVRAEAWFRKHRPRIADFRSHLYQREIYTDYTTGSVLLYRHDTWHRGTPIRSGNMRLAHNLTFRRMDAEWISTLHPGWAWAMYQRDQRMERIVANSNTDQRTLLGFPAPGDPYWTKEKIDAVEARYRSFGFDASPYRDALAWTGL
ncbi:MAG: phytanoyl-CoA dioxygenase family protein [Actinomycetota bacterium]|nr:phytanoyl-CoA dioxygenase family protein [Acidimicrobiales bacterium]MEE2805719.1 phytanoyl-CoA dioxygenase family protein [Actinomycetota bacterium]